MTTESQYNTRTIAELQERIAAGQERLVLLKKVNALTKLNESLWQKVQAMDLKMDALNEHVKELKQRNLELWDTYRNATSTPERTGGDSSIPTDAIVHDSLISHATQPVALVSVVQNDNGDESTVAETDELKHWAKAAYMRLNYIHNEYYAFIDNNSWLDGAPSCVKGGE